MPAPEISPPVTPTPPIPSEPPPIAPTIPAQPTPPTVPDSEPAEAPTLDPDSPDIMPPERQTQREAASTPHGPVELHRAEANTIARHSHVTLRH